MGVAFILWITKVDPLPRFPSPVMAAASTCRRWAAISELAGT